MTALVRDLDKRLRKNTRVEIFRATGIETRPLEVSTSDDVEVRGMYTQTVYIEADSPAEAKREAARDPWQYDWEPEPILDPEPKPTRKPARLLGEAS